MAEGDFLQQTNFPTREAPGGGAQQAAISDDSKFSTSETQRLQAQAQQRINAGRHDHIGVAP
jgi:hypothetical protein